MRLTEPWLTRDEALACLHGNLGVFQLADSAGKVVFIGFAGGLSKFALLGEVREAFEVHGIATQVRYEITSAYHTRYRELLMLHIADHGAWPTLNDDTSDITLGQLSPNPADKARLVAKTKEMGLYAPCYGTFGGAGLAQLFEATDDQKERYLYPTLRGEKRGFFGLSEPSGGSDPARNGVTCFIVDTDTPGFHVRRVLHTLRSAHYATELQFEDMRVPDKNILGKVNRGFAIANDRLTRQRIPYAAGCIGVAIEAHEMALEYVSQRETFGAPLSTRQSIQWMLVDNEIDIKQSLWITLEAANKANKANKGEPFRKGAAMAKLVATEAGGRVVDRCMQMFGALGVAKVLPFERWFREMRIRRIGEGPSEVPRHVIARELLGASLR